AGRVVFQCSPQVRLMVRGNVSRLFTPFDPRYTGGSSQTPSSTESTGRPSNELYGAPMRGFTTGAVKEFKVGSRTFFFRRPPPRCCPTPPPMRRSQRGRSAEAPRE